MVITAPVVGKLSRQSLEQIIGTLVGGVLGYLTWYLAFHLIAHGSFSDVLVDSCRYCCLSINLPLPSSMRVLNDILSLRQHQLPQVLLCIHYVNMRIIQLKLTTAAVDAQQAVACHKLIMVPVCL